MPSPTQHELFFTVQPGPSGAGLCDPQVETRQVRFDKILDWVSFEELTRFEHHKYAEYEARTKAKRLERHRRRLGLDGYGRTALPLGPVIETDLSSDDEVDDVSMSPSTMTPGEKRPRGRPRKHLRSPPLSHSRKRLLSPDTRPRHPFSGSSPVAGRADPAFEHVTLPQVKKRVRRNDATLTTRHQFPAVVISKQSPSTEPLVNDSSAVPSRSSARDGVDMIYNPVIAYPDSENEQRLYPTQEFYPLQSRISGIIQNPHATQRSFPLPSRIPEIISSASSSSESSHDDMMKTSPAEESRITENDDGHVTIDESSDEDELTILHNQFGASSRTNLNQPSPNDQLLFKPQLDSSSPSIEEDDFLMPDKAREMSIDLGDRSSSPDLMTQTPIKLQRHFVTTKALDTPMGGLSSSDDSMKQTPVRLKRRPTETRDHADQTNNLSSSQDSLDQIPVVLKRRSEAATNGKGITNIITLDSSSSDSSQEDEDSASSKHVNNIQMTRKLAPRKTPLARPQSSTPAGNIGSMGAGQTFPTFATPQHHRAVLTTVNPEPDVDYNPWGQPLPLHPTTPTTSIPSSNATHQRDTKTPKTTTQRKKRQSMTPLFPRAAILPDLSAFHESPSKRRQPILSTQQFQT